jgi:hypothetical protein
MELKTWMSKNIKKQVISKPHRETIDTSKFTDEQLLAYYYICYYYKEYLDGNDK